MAGIVRDGVIANLIKEELQLGVTKVTNDADPVFERIMTSSVGVLPDSELGKGYLHIKTYKDGHGGAAWWQESGGPAENTESNISGTVSMAAGTGYPGRRFMRLSTNFRRQLRLVQIKGNITLPKEYFRVDQLSSTIAPLVLNEVEDTKERVAFMRAQAFFAKNATNVDNILCTVGTVTAGGDTLDNTVTFSLGTGEHVRGIFKGQHVEVWNAAGTVRKHSDAAALSGSSTSLCIVDSYDPRGNTLKLALLSGTWEDADVVATDVVIALQDPTRSGADVTAAGRKPTATYGFRDWQVSSGTIFNESQTTGIDTDVRQVMQSVTADLGGNVITDKDFHTYFARHDNAVGAKVKLDSIITSHKVVNGYLDYTDDQASVERNGVIRKPRIGYDELKYVFAGTPVEIMISRWIQDDTLTAMKLNDGNLKRLVAPGLSGPAGTATVRDGVEFVLPAMGQGGIFRMANNSDGSASDDVEAPYEVLEQIAPDWPQGILLTNVGGNI